MTTSSAISTPMSLLTKVIFWFVAANALAGALSLILFSNQTNNFFFWEIKPPINAALFGALYLSGALMVGWLTYRGRWEAARFLIPVLVSAGFFISLTTLIHLERFSQDLKLGYWLFIYIGAPILALMLHIHQERRGASWTITTPVTRATRAVAVITGVIVLAAGAVLFLSPASAIPYWPWATSPLMVRTFASWFGAFGIGLVWFMVERDWARLQNIANLMIAASALDLVMIFLHREDLSDNGASLGIYCFHLIAFGLIGVLMHWLQRTSVPVSTAQST
jgi:hypothetical protein